jgi:hypothetical protein
VIGTLMLLSIVIPLKITGNICKAPQLKETPLSSLSETPTKEEIKEATVYIADKYLIDKSQLLTTIQCESSFKYNAIGDNGLAIGVAQFHKPTFDRFCKGEYTSTKDQLKCMAEMWQKGYQRHWSCWKTYFSN